MNEHFIPRDDRQSLAIEGHLIHSDGRKQPVVVSEISRNGCRVDGPALLPIGSDVTITLGRGVPIDGQVRWSLGTAAGLRFSDTVRL